MAATSFESSPPDKADIERLEQQAREENERLEEEDMTRRRTGRTKKT